MRDARNFVAPAQPPKSRTGIVGFDDITGGGLPLGRTTLVMGGPGSGKTLFALQFLAHGAQLGGKPGIFVSFEEDSKRLMANASSFGWRLEDSLAGGTLFFIDAQPAPDLVPAISTLAGFWPCRTRRSRRWARAASCSTRWTSCWPCCPTTQPAGARSTSFIPGCWATL